MRPHLVQNELKGKLHPPPQKKYDSSSLPNANDEYKLYSFNNVCIAYSMGQQTYMSSDFNCNVVSV